MGPLIATFASSGFSRGEEAYGETEKGVGTENYYPDCPAQKKSDQKNHLHRKTKKGPDNKLKGPSERAAEVVAPARDSSSRLPNRSARYEYGLIELQVEKFSGRVRTVWIEFVMKQRLGEVAVD